MGRGRNILFIHLETQYAKTYCKNEIYAKNWVRRTLIENFNLGEKSTIKVNASQRFGQRWRQLIGRVSSVDDVAVMTSPRANVSKWTSSMFKRVGKSDGAWRYVTTRGGAWWHMKLVSFCADSFGSAWWRVEALMMVRFPREGRSVDGDLSGTYKNTIGVMITVATVWQWSQESEWR